MFRPERLLAFSDGVIAIAITLLVLGIEVPSVHDVPERDLTSYLLASWRSMVGFINSFILIGTFWFIHYAIFHEIERVDRGLLALNGLFLLAVSFMPFPTGLQAVYRGDELAMLLYGASALLCGLLLLAIWAYACTRGLVVDPLPQAFRTRVFRQIAIAPSILLVAMAASLVNLTLARLILLAVPLAYFRLKGRMEDQAETVSPPSTA